MSASLHAPSDTTTGTPNKKPSVISNNKPNCNVPKGDEKTKDIHHSDVEAKKGINTPKQSSEEKQNIPKREITPDIISGASIQKAVEQNDSMEPQVMVEDEEISSIEQKEIEPPEAEVVTNTASNDEKKETTNEQSNEHDRIEDPKDDDHPSHEHTPSKQIITSEEEAKARIAQKRREMKEKMEREAELERQRQVLIIFIYLF